MPVDDHDIIHCFQNLWIGCETTLEGRTLQHQVWRRTLSSVTYYYHSLPFICLYQILVQCLITDHNIRFNKVSMLQKNLWVVFNCNTINLKQKYHPKILTFQRFEALFTNSLSLHLILRLSTSEAISPLAMTIRNYCWNIHSAIPLHLSPEDNLIMYRHSYNLCC